MTIPTAPGQPVCPLGVSERTLSALRDASVSRVGADRLNAHVATCAACRERLAALDSLADILRSEHPPEPDGRLWPAITTASPADSSASMRRPLRFSVRPRGSGAATYNRVGALVAVLLLTVGFVALFSLRHPVLPAQQRATATASSSATATSQPSLLPAQPLTWRSVGVSSPQGDIAFADDGKSAYKCAISDDTQGNSIVNIWRTTDRGVHWSPAREVPSEPTANFCQLVVDATDPSVASLAWQPRGAGGGDSYVGLMTTIDGGVSWQAIPTIQPFVRIDQLESRGGVIYAVRETADSATNSVVYHLWASDDHMKTWRQMDHDIPEPIAGFWLQPDGDGILLVASDGAPGGSSGLWSSPDGGATWRSLTVTVPGGLPPYMTARVSDPAVRPVGIVARWLQGQLHICASRVVEGSSTPDVICSTDGGASWHTRPTPPLSASRGPAVNTNLVGITNDGALLAASGGVLYRLAVSASQWQSLGPLPGAYVYYAPAPGGGVLWAAPDVLGEPTDPQNRVFTADYSL